MAWYGLDRAGPFDRAWWKGHHCKHQLYIGFLEDEDFYLESALVWGSSVKHKPQRVGREHELEDEDVVQIIKKV
ncbi:developmentally-regulated G-protein 3 [Phtheirospermum japonicum]|uniref:Developmentally-regulated G-protein 3 n=1 Tax=Phtheirospermum japonicum TaxID=374723 RepID=A0A830D3F1_9LAMI|nr:developmentally-regulated G-protein 3 [Phtheirospermum japonicum]